MKFLIPGNYYPDSFESNIADTLRGMGHEVVGVSPNIFEKGKFALHRYVIHAQRFIPRIEEIYFNKLVQKIRDYQPDVIFNIAAPIGPALMRKIRRVSRAKIILWYPDHFGTFDRQYMIASDYDYLFFKDEYIVEFFREKLNKPAFYMPEACNPAIHRRVQMSPEELDFFKCDITTASNLYYYRANIFENLLDYDVKIWGTNCPDWLESPVRSRYQFRFVAGLEKSKAFNAAKIVLNTLHYAEIRGVNARTFEAAGCGGFQIVDWRPVVGRFFLPDQEIVTYRSIGELKDKVAYYLKHDEERMRIADSGHARAHRDHTYEKRLSLILDTLEGRAEGYPLSG